MKRSTATLAALLAALSPTSLVKADVSVPQPQYHAHWTFTELTGYHYEDYSTNLDIPLGATLPVEAVKAGWACQREPIWHGYNDLGTFTCNNGSEVHWAQATCALDKINSDYAWMDIKPPGAADGIRFSVSCTAFSD